MLIRIDIFISVFGLILFIAGIVRNSRSKTVYVREQPQQIPSGMMNGGGVGGYTRTGAPVNPQLRYWTCFKCNRTNPETYNFCKCGMSQAESYQKYNEMRYSSHNPNIQDVKQSKDSINQEAAKKEIEKRDLIKKYKELLDLNIITKKEFEEKKLQYLGNSNTLSSSDQTVVATTLQKKL